MAIEVGKNAPDFMLKNQNSEAISLSDYRDKIIILYFYPKDLTPGCTTQACDFRDHHEIFQNTNTVIIGVSPDPIERHQKFINKYSLPFHLLADEDHQVAKLYEVWQLKKMFGREFYGIVRSTFIIDQAGVLQKEFRNVRVKGHVNKVLTYVKENLL